MGYSLFMVADFQNDLISGIFRLFWSGFFHRTTLKAGFHMIANDRRRSRIADRRSQTIAKRPVSI